MQKGMVGISCTHAPLQQEEPATSGASLCVKVMSCSQLLLSQHRAGVTGSLYEAFRHVAALACAWTARAAGHIAAVNAQQATMLSLAEAAEAQQEPATIR